MKSMEQVLQKITVLTNSTNLLGNQHKKNKLQVLHILRDDDCIRMSF